jgi:hypothetical protein
VKAVREGTAIDVPKVADGIKGAAASQDLSTSSLTAILILAAAGGAVVTLVDDESYVRKAHTSVKAYPRAAV